VNYLAHLYLADDDPESIIGNLMGDFVKGRLDESIPTLRARGILRHRRIDAYTDAHPIFRRSKRRIRPDLRRYGGILIDMYYDHYLARDWARYSSVSLRMFSDSVYDILQTRYDSLPVRMQRSVSYMIRNDLLMTYQELSGIAHALRGIQRRLRRTNRLGEAIVDLELNYAALEADFRDFFPELVAYVQES